MAASKKSLGLNWQDLTIEVSYQRNWLNSGQTHLEIRASERLPITETGYRSHFLPDGAMEKDEAEIRAFVLEWLDRAATSSTWQAYLEDCRQLRLF